MPRSVGRAAISGAALLAALVWSPWGPGPIVGGKAAYAQPLPSSARPGLLSCSELKGLRSQHSREPTKITFVNRNSTYRGLYWIDFQGKEQSYGGLNPGTRKTISTFRTHPWLITTGPGDCLQLILPAAEPATVQLK